MQIAPPFLFKSATVRLKPNLEDIENFSCATEADVQSLYDNYKQCVQVSQYLRAPRMSRHQYERTFYYCNCIFDPILSDAFEVDVSELVLRDISTHPFFYFLLFCFLKYILFFSL